MASPPSANRSKAWRGHSRLPINSGPKRADQQMTLYSPELDISGLGIADLDMELAEISLVPDLRKCAILLDIDGTILDLAPSPQQVWVPPGLRRTLARLDDLTGGAVALVSGRPLADIDLIFSPLQLAAIGGHGAELRVAADAEPLMRAGPLCATLKRKLASVTEIGPGILAENK